MNIGGTCSQAWLDFTIKVTVLSGNIIEIFIVPGYIGKRMINSESTSFEPSERGDTTVISAGMGTIAPLESVILCKFHTLYITFMPVLLW